MLVLDEADRLLDLGFSEELQRLLALLPGQRQTLFFSATFPEAVQTLAAGLLREPVRIEVLDAPDEVPEVVRRLISTLPSAITPKPLTSGQW